jgi:hypothetical protein
MKTDRYVPVTTTTWSFTIARSLSVMVKVDMVKKDNSCFSELKHLENEGNGKDI